MTATNHDNSNACVACGAPAEWKYTYTGGPGVKLDNRVTLVCGSHFWHMSMYYGPYSCERVDPDAVTLRRAP